MDKTSLDPDRISSAFRQIRDQIICPSCNTAGRITFSRDGNGRLRFGCANKPKSCRKSFSMATMTTMIEAVDGNILSNGNIILDTQTVTLTSIQAASGTQAPNTHPTKKSLPSITQTCLENDLSIAPVGINAPLNVRTDINNLVEEFNDQRKKRICSNSSPEALRSVRPRLTTTNTSVNNTSDSEDENLINDHDLIIYKQASEISLLREEVKELTTQVTNLVSFFDKLQKSGVLNPNTLKEFTTTQTTNSLTSNSSIDHIHPVSAQYESSLITHQTTDPTLTLKDVTSTAKKSYADIAASRGLKGEAQQAGIKALQALCKRPRIKPNFSNLQRVYVQGIARQPIKQLKNLLQTVRIRTSAIPSISFVGLQTVEFLVTCDYINGFKKAINDLSPVKNRFRILETFDASKASDPSASTALKAKLQSAFVHRIHNIISKNTNKPAQDHYLNWLNELDLPPPILEQEPIHPHDEEQVHEQEEEEDFIEEEAMAEDDVSTPPMSPVSTTQQAVETSL